MTKHSQINYAAFTKEDPDYNKNNSNNYFSKHVELLCSCEIDDFYLSALKLQPNLSNEQFSQMLIDLISRPFAKDKELKGTSLLFNPFTELLQIVIFYSSPIIKS